MKKILLTFSIALISVIVYAQNSVGIGTTTPSNNAVLELVSPGNNQGFMVPKLTTAQRTAIGPGLTDEALLVYDMDLQSFMYWDGLAWSSIGGSDNDWIENNDTIYNNTHYVVVGQTSPLQEVKMLVVNNGLRSAFAGSSSGNGTDAIGVQGYAKSAPNLNIGVSGLAESSSATDTIVGTAGQAELSAGGWGIGVLGEVKNGTTGGYGIFGNAEGVGSGTMVGVYGTAIGGTNNYAGFFQDGDVVINNRLGIDQLNPLTRIHIGDRLHLNYVNVSGLIFNTYTNNLVYNGTDWVRTVAGTGVASYMGNAEYGMEFYGNGAAGSLASTQTAEFRIDTTRATFDIRGVGSEGLDLTSYTDRTLILDLPYDGSDPRMIFRNTIGDEVGIRSSSFTTGSYDLTLPTTAGNPNEVLTTDGSGVLSWTSPGGGTEWNLLGNSGTNPNINFIGTTDAQDLVFKTVGVEGARLQTDGRFGVGDFSTLAALDNLEVRGDFGTATFNHTDAQQYSAIQFAETNSVFGFVGQWGSTSGTNPLDMQIGNFYAGGGGIKFSVNGAGNLTSPAMTIANNSNVGIGTISPTSLLHVSGVADPVEVVVENGGGNFKTGYTVKTALNEWFIGQEATSASGFRITDADAGAVRFQIDETSGNVGIGTINPGTSKLMVDAGSFNFIGISTRGKALVGQVDRNANLTVANRGLASNNVVVVEGQNFQTGSMFEIRNFGAANGDLMTVNSAGDVGIGIATPTDKLHIVGTSGNTLRIVDGNEAAGRVLTSAADGSASWAVPAAGAVDEIVDADADTKIQVEESADEDKIRFDLGGTEFYSMEENVNGISTLNVDNNQGNVFMGVDVALNADYTNSRWNVGIGDLALQNLTSGYHNLGMGFAALQSLTSGTYNIGLIAGSGMGITSGNGNFAAGELALQLNQTGNNNIAIGQQAIRQTRGSGNIGMGQFAGRGVLAGFTGTGLTIIGHNAVSTTNFNASNITAYGYQAGANVTTGGNNTFVGYQSGDANTTGSSNTALGYLSDVGAAVTNATAIGANTTASQSNSVILGNSADVGIGTSTPTAKLDVRGSLFFPNAGTPGANKVLTSDATGNATWENIAGGSSLRDGDGDTEINVEAAPDQDVIHFSLGNSTGYPGAEYFTMIGPRLEVINSGRSVFLGELAGQNDDLGVNNNVFIGYQAGMTNIGGGNNTALGSGALSSSNSMYNTAVGYHALNANTNSGNSALGNNTLRNNTVGNSNTAMGYEAMIANINGNVNTAIGYEALLSNISGNSNAALGYRTLRSSTSDNNSAVGQGALRLTSTGGNNTALGFQAGDVNTIGTENTFLGYNSDASSNSLSNATAIGANALVNASNTVQLGNGADIDFDGALMPNSLPGAAGDVLTSQGPGVAPIWAAGGGGGAFATALNITSNSPGDFGNDDFVFGSPSLDDDADATHDTRMLFDKSTGAFRAGSVSGNQWNAVNRGFNSASFGVISNASGSNSFAAGDFVNTTGTASFGFGWNNSVSGSASGVFGMNNTTNGNRSFTMGEFVETNANNAFSFGKGASSVSRLVNNNQNSMMIGFNSNIPTVYVGPSAGAGTSGDVGIGTSTPAHKLHVFEDNNPSIYLEDGNNAVRIQGGTDMRLFTNGLERVTLLETGNVGIGVYAANELLTVEGVLSLRETSGVANDLNYGKFYADAGDNKPHFMASDGVDYDLTAGGGSGWALTGNGGTAATDFVGTTDGQALRFRTNNVQRVEITDIGNLNYGTSNSVLGSTSIVMGTANSANATVGIAIGSNNNATGHRSTSLGHYANSAHLGSMVLGDWSGSAPAFTQSSATDQFTSRFNGGYRFFTTSSLDVTAGVYFANGGNVGIGNLAPTEKLDVEGNIVISDEFSEVHRTTTGADKTGDYHMLPIAYGITDRFASGGAPFNTITPNANIQSLGGGQYSITINDYNNFAAVVPVVLLTLLDDGNGNSRGEINYTILAGNQILVNTFDSGGTSVNRAFSFTIFAP